MSLTPKQESFAQAYIEGGNASEAYRRVYRASRMKAETVNRKAFDLLQNGKIAARVSEMQAKSAEAAQFTLADHLRRLDELSRAAEAAQKFDAAVKAEENRGKAAGFYKDRVELTGAAGGPMEYVGMTPSEFEKVARRVADAV